MKGKMNGKHMMSEKEMGPMHKGMEYGGKKGKPKRKRGKAKK